MNSTTPLRIVVLVSGNGSNLEALIAGCATGEIPACIVAVISNRPDAHALERAARHGIPAVALDHRGFPTRAAFDQALRDSIDAHAPDLVVLAGFMRILTPGFVAHYAGRMLNIHPSLLPAYPGLHTHARALADGAAQHGASIHFVTSELDGGPVVLQGEVPVAADDDPARLAARVQRIEHLIYPRAVAWYAAGRLRLSNGHATLDGAAIVQPQRLRLKDIEHADLNV
ncbi:phosphoribosylglycinamide formyltransferase [Acidihalobacter ferrooxydans]|uniref:Phosphoribosylglycinamide formyltransferase n=1 Tax=Acidihalobacter ferrooxydans TaxID=1765967 RepID=A0A1P8UJA7_9GAMM|nr:phosphoribosylglycinamide formyltransferase [Acidihalobacter ferrooxydans]APZ43926.1 phosphoribosylglycinamide formyltransferase [Acidihalobacter ferrooxydans]